jgi:hypothetical protein
MQLSFVPAMKADGTRVAAGPDAGGLARDSTCSFLNRGVKADEPVGIRFRLESGSAAESPKAHLGSSKNYWAFHVYKRPYGYFHAVRHGAWKPAAPPPGADTDDHVVSIADVKVTPGVRGVDFKFTARPDSAPYIELRARPRVVKSAADGARPKALRLNAHRSDGNKRADAARYASSSRAHGLLLLQDTLYHYTITVPGDAATPEQHVSGSFTTRPQRVTTPVRGSATGVRNP